MSKTYYVTTQTRQQVISLLAMKGDDQQITVDFSAWAEDNSDLTSVTWSVPSGQASVDGTSLTSNVATGRITTSEAGKSLIKLSATDGTRTKTVFIQVTAKDPNTVFSSYDYGLVRA